MLDFILARESHRVRNKATGRISQRVLQENKARQIFRKTNISYSLTHTRFEIRNLPYHRRVMTDNSQYSIKHYNNTTKEVKQTLDKCNLDKYKTTCMSLNSKKRGGNLWRLIKHVKKYATKN